MNKGIDGPKIEKEERAFSLSMHRQYLGAKYPFTPTLKLVLRMVGMVMSMIRVWMMAVAMARCVATSTLLQFPISCTYFSSVSGDHSPLTLSEVSDCV